MGSQEDSLFHDGVNSFVNNQIQLFLYTTFSLQNQIQLLLSRANKGSKVLMFGATLPRGKKTLVHKNFQDL